MAGPFAPSGRRAAARRRTPGGLGPRARPRPRCGLGLGAALWAGLAARASASPPHTPPARLGAADGKAGGCQPCGLVGAPVRALWARPSRPPAACGPLPLPTLGGWGAARPARLRRSGSCGGWSPPSAAQVCAPSGLASRQPLRGATQSGRKAKPPSGAASRALPPASPAPVAASVLRAAPPPLVGAFGAVRPSGPGVPGSGQPPRGGSAYARPARRSGPAPLRRPAAEPRGGVRALWARPVRGRNLDAAR